MSHSETIDMGIAHHQAGRVREAELIYRQVLRADPTNVSAWNLLAVLATQLKRHEVAIQCLETALRIRPDSAELHYNMGFAWQGLGKIDEAIVSYQQAIKYDPLHARAHNNLGAALKEQGKLSEAIASIQQALQLDAKLVEGYCNLGIALHAQSHWREALESFEKAVALKPDFAQAYTNHAMILLASGDFERGWPEYEWRWKAGQLPDRNFGRPRWDGRPLQGQTVLLHAEQGLGDTLLFIRYAPLVKAMGATVIVECPRALTRLLVRCAGIDRLVPCGDELPPFDVHIPLLSLPAKFNTTVDNVPANVPYLLADQGLIYQWREKLAALRGFKIGINWRGRAGQGDFRHRDIPLEFFAGLSEMPITFVSLQQGATAEELARAASPLPIFHPGEDFDRSHGAFMDTAAIMKNLDLVISSDTSVPHLAGALGVPVWVALPYVAGWQWMRDRADSPWYPAARLFRQKRPGDWAGVFDEIRTNLARQLG